MTGGEGALKSDMMKQHELDSFFILQMAKAGTYNLATEPELDTDFTEVDLAKMEAKQESKFEVNSHTSSTVQGEDALQGGVLFRSMSIL